MRVTRFLVGLLLLGLLVSCQKELSPSDYVRWVESVENGLKKSKKVGHLQVEVQYKPISFVVANELRKNKIDNATFQARKKDLEGLQHYNLKLSTTQQGTDITNWNVADQTGQQVRLNYLSFGMQKDIFLVEEGDTLPCLLYHFERSYDMANHRTFVLGFKQKTESTLATKTLILDSPVFGTGPLKFRFESKDLSNLPPLKLDA